MVSNFDGFFSECGEVIFHWHLNPFRILFPLLLTILAKPPIINTRFSFIKFVHKNKSTSFLRNKHTEKFVFSTCKMAGIVVVFDFDKTIIDHDSDNWVIDELGFTQLFDQLLPTMPWNSLMDKMMLELHSNGKTIEDIANVLRRAPLDPNIISAIKSAHSLG
ncbi:hypothetical protein MKX01_035509, partial [Papaver californicum]